MPPSPRLQHGDAALDDLSAQLSGRGWGTLAIAAADPLLLRVHDEALGHAAAGRLMPASTGRVAGRLPGGDRGDSTLWLDDPACGSAALDLLAGFAILRVDLNRRLTLGMAEVEAQFATYPVGTGYARHLDRFRSDDARVLSLVLYLNPAWPDDAGGALRLHLARGAHDIAPCQGTLAVFLSAEIEHEVMPATLVRLSVAAWFRQSPRPV